jgi:hypothetical protein
MMRVRRFAYPAVVVFLCAVASRAQCPLDVAFDAAPAVPVLPVELVVPEGTPLRVALRDRVRVGKAGEPVRAVVTHPVYAFDDIVIPAGSEVRGRLARISPVARKKRFLAFLNANFTPARDYALEFDTLVLPDGRQIRVTTEVSPGMASVVRLVAQPQPEKRKNPVARAASGAKHEVSRQVRGTIDTIKSPGRWDRLKRHVAAQLPVRRQYLEPGTRFSAVLAAPLEFGIAWRAPEYLAELGSAPAEDSVLEARLAAPVTSATARPGQTVESVVTAPLFSTEGKLVVPAHSRLLGEVVSAKPARKLHRSGQLRLAFRHIELPDGVARAIHGSLAALEVDRAAGLQLDREGGAKAADSKRRYASTAIAIGVATLATQREGGDPEEGELVGEDPGLATQAAAGGSGYRLVGVVATSAVGSPAFSAALGAYGAAASVYRNFLSRGRNVTLPKDTPIEISLGRLRQPPEKDAP